MKMASKYALITVLPGIILGVPILMIDSRHILGIPSYARFSTCVIGIFLFLSIIYYLFQWKRLDSIIQRGETHSLYRIPFMGAMHMMLNFIIFGPVLFLIMNQFLYIAPLSELVKGVWTAISLGIIEYGLVYCISYSLLIPYYKSLPGIQIKGPSLTQKLIIILAPAILFSIYNGFILTKSWIGYFYLLLPFSLLYAAIMFIKDPVDSLIEGFDKSLSLSPDISMKGVVVSGDELQVLAEKFHTFIELLSNTINNIKENALEVRRQTETLSSGVEKITTSGEKISGPIKEINLNSHEVIDNIKLIQHNIENLSSISKEIESQMQIFDNIAKKSVSLANRGEEITEEAVEMIEITSPKMEKSMQNLEVLSGSFNEVKGFTQMMESVSDDTSLLALNASVEAARVGKKSKGFTVIAEEIRRLSNDSAKYLEKMKESIKQMNEAVQLAVSSADENSTISRESKEKIEKTKAKFTEISESIAMTMNLAEQIDEIQKEAINSINGIMEAVSLLPELITRQVVTTEIISTAIKKQTSSIEETGALAEKLLQLEDEMMKGIKRYSD